MEHNNKAIFESLVRDIRNDCQLFGKLYIVLLNKTHVESPQESATTRDELREWILDVFVDKSYEIENKVGIVFKKILNRDIPNIVHNAVAELRRSAHELAFSQSDNPLIVKGHLQRVKKATDGLISSVEWSFSELRETLWISGWKFSSTINPTELLEVERRKYVKARDELHKARQNASDHPEDVMNYLRQAIDLAIKERFRFKKIPKMIVFIEQAKKLGFPLPSYDLIYTYFNEGSQRIHEGKIHTLFEANQTIRTVSDFMDELELIEVTQEQIKDFSDKCNCVKI